MPESARREQSRSLLIVCGDSNTLDSLTRGLSSRAYAVMAATSGVEALELLRRHRFSAMIVEFTLYGVTPQQLIEAARRMHPQLIIIALLPNCKEAEKRPALASGASEVHVGPISPPELDSILRRRIREQAVMSNRLSTVRAEVLQKAIRAIASAVDVKMRFPSARSSQVTEMCKAMAVQLGLSPEQIDRLELAALLHDIGMIAVPDDIVAKPTKLDDIDWVDVLKHPALGGAMLSGVPELVEVAAAVRHHHERVDGQGYPDGLFGDAIPLFARIIAVADAYAAMTSERPHRKARTHSEAVAELRKNAGKQFDAELTEVLISAVESAMELKAA